MRLLSVILIGFCSSSFAHVKWMDYQATAGQDQVNILVAEGMQPFVAQRSFYIDKTTLISANGQKLSSDSYLITETTTQKGTIQHIVTQENIGFLVVENGPLFKRAKVAKRTGEFVPDRIEFSRISMLHNPKSLVSIKKPEPLHIDLLPDRKNSLKPDSLFSLQVFKNGQPFKPAHVKIYGPDTRNETFDIQILEDGVLTFRVKQVGKYLIQVDDMSEIAGFPGYPNAHHLHLFSSIIFKVTE
jgi:uncharacterized GH25 family protein